MNRLIKYFSVFGVLLVFAAYFFRLFEVNGFVKAIAAVENPDSFYKAMGIVYKVDYFFIALIMVSCLASLILMNKEGSEKILFSVSLISIGIAIIEKIYIVIASSIVYKRTLDSNISISNIVNIVILALGLFSIINSILVKRFLGNSQLAFFFSIFSIATIVGSTSISIYASIVGVASIHFIIYTIFFILAIILFVIEFIMKFKSSLKMKVEKQD